MKIIESEETAMMDNFERREIERMYRDGYGPTAISYESVSYTHLTLPTTPYV